MDVVLAIVMILGALGVFLYGMKLMSESLQKVAGPGLRRLLRKITANRLYGVLTGFAITVAVQSSSATTVMIVSFVNAKLLDLRQAIGVLMGANIGTTMTGWLVALLGFNVKITSFALPAVALGFALTFFRQTRARQLGETLVGFGLLFIGLELLKQQIPAITPEQVLWVESLADLGFLSTLLFVGVGTLLTIALQSSSATMALTLTLTAAGSIPYEAAIGMILGENIGTTITANLASIGTSVAAKRTARAHTIFNLIGVTWAVALLHPVMLPLVDTIVPGGPTDGQDALTAHLAAFHTLFNIANTLLLLPFVRHLTALVTRVVPDRGKAKRRVSRFLMPTHVDTPELVLELAGHELRHMNDIAHAMYRDAMRILSSPNERLGTLVQDTLEREGHIDDLEREIAEVLTTAARATNSPEAAADLGLTVLNAHALERIGDHCEKLVELAVKNHEGDEERFDAEALADIARLGENVDRALELLGAYLDNDRQVDASTEIERVVDAMRSELYEKHVQKMHESEMHLVTGLRLLDVFHQLEAIGDRAYAVVMRSEEARTGTRRSKQDRHAPD